MSQRRNRCKAIPRAHQATIWKLPFSHAPTKARIDVRAGRTLNRVVTKLLPIALLACVALTACKTKYGLGKTEPGTGAAPAAATPSPAKSTPMAASEGRIASARGDLKFVVVDFSPNTVPAVGTKMNVYRNGQKVGELQISGPAEASNIAADIIAGKAQPGDSVRID